MKGKVVLKARLAFSLGNNDPFISSFHVKIVNLPSGISKGPDRCRQAWLTASEAGRGRKPGATALASRKAPPPPKTLKQRRLPAC